MKSFFKENIVHILLLLLFSLILILFARVTIHEFYKEGNFENIDSLRDRIRTCSALGWQVDETSETKRNIFIQKIPDDDFRKYNEFQKMCGFDLAPFMGRGAVVYTYRILNFPAKNPVNAFLNIIIYKGKMIGGDCSVEEYDDLYLPVRLPELDAYIS